MTGPLDDPHPRGLVRALLAVLALGLLVAVVPIVLVALTQALPVDLGALSPATWGRAASPGTPAPSQPSAAGWNPNTPSTHAHNRPRPARGC